MTQEHFIPVALGGGYTAGNILPACQPCNSSKRHIHPTKWVKNTAHLRWVIRTLRNLKEITNGS